MSSLRVMLLFVAVHLAGLAVGAWVVLSVEAALLLTWLAVMLTVMSLPFGKQMLLRPLFAFVYRRWLWNDWHLTRDRVLRVTGWRSALVKTRDGQRRHMTACFWGLE